MIYASETVTATPFLDTELWIIVSNVLIIAATIALTYATFKAARVAMSEAHKHEEHVVDSNERTTHDLTEIIHEVLVQEHRLEREEHKVEALAEAAPPAKADESAQAPLRAVK